MARPACSLSVSPLTISTLLPSFVVVHIALPLVLFLSVSSHLPSKTLTSLYESKSHSMFTVLLSGNAVMRELGTSFSTRESMPLVFLIAIRSSATMAQPVRIELLYRSYRNQMLHQVHISPSCRPLSAPSTRRHHTSTPHALPASTRH